MARKSSIQQWLDSGKTSAEFRARWEKGGESRDGLISEVGYANEGAAYNAARNAGILAGGPVSTGTSNGNGNGTSNGAKAPRGVRGVLPIEIERWAILSAQADWIRSGYDPDDFISTLVTPEFFFSLRAVRGETKAYSKILDRIGGLDSDAGKSLRAWAGHPLTAVQAAQEAATLTAPRDRAVAMKILAAAQAASPSFRESIVGLVLDQFGETLFDRLIGNELLAI